MNKEGALSVELPINMANPEENIEKYLNTPLKIEKGPNVQKIGNSTIMPENSQNMKSLINSIQESDLKMESVKKSTSFNNYPNLMKSNPTYNNNTSFIEKERKEREKKELEEKENITYVKIICIRENEHFGDVFMFLEQRSPLRVRVRSVKCELFFLRKIDAIEISTNYQNIWQNIIKKSVINYQQMKMSIKNIVEIYSLIKTTIHQNDKKIHKKQQTFKILKEDLCYSKSYNIPKINYSVFFKNIEMNNDLLIKDNNNKKRCLSEKKLQRKIYLNLDNNNNKLDKSSSNSSLSFDINKKSKKNKKKNKSDEKKNNKKKVKFGQKVLDAFNGKYKFYKQKTNENNNNFKTATIISEETEQDVNIENYQNNSLKQNKSKLTVPSLRKRKSSFCQNIENNNVDLIDNNDNEEENEKENEKEK